MNNQELNINKDMDIIEEIQNIRAKNNICWMDILRLAFMFEPEKAKEIFKKITENDREINELSKKLGRNNVR